MGVRGFGGKITQLFKGVFIMANLHAFGDAWDFYPCVIDDDQYSVRFNVGALHLDEQQRAAFPHTMALRIPFLEARENGFPTIAEIERINNIEDALKLRDNSVRHIGVLTGKGATSFVFCGGGSPEKMEAKGRKLMARQKAEYSIEMHPDDNFGYFDNILAPDLYDSNWMTDRQVCDNLERHGDTLTAPREIDFYIYFKNEADMDIIAAKLLEQGFAEAEREQTEDGEFGLSLTMEAIPSLSNINGITSGI
jgi:hypothetical protein